MKLKPIPNYLLKTHISIKEKKGIDETGMKKYGSKLKQEFSFSIIFGSDNIEEIKRMCRLEKYDRQQYSKLGDNINYIWIAYLDGDVTVSNDSDCTIEGHDKIYIIKNIDIHLNPDGTTHHTKLYLI